MERLYIDVSRYQGTIDWAKVKAAGVEGVLIKTVSTNKKLSSRSDGLYIDPTFERNYAGAKAAGIPVGVYYYTYATTKAMADAELALLKEALQGKTMDLPVVVDVEDNKLTKQSKESLTDLVAYQLKTVEKMGFYAMLYTGLNFANTRLYMGGAALKKFDVWLAAYRKTKPDKDADGFTFGIWQYTSTGKVDGISGNVDMNLAYKNYAAIIRNAGLTALRT